MGRILGQLTTLEEKLNIHVLGGQEPEYKKQKNVDLLSLPEAIVPTGNLIVQL